jgi:hypothetical protein
MTSSRLIRAVVAVLLLLALPSFAAAATTEFRVLFDADNDPATGCTVNGMDGVDHVLVTRVTDDAGAARVTRTHREICTGTVLGGAVDIVTTGWDAGWNNTNKLLTIETRIPFSAFGSAETMPSIIRAGFDATRNGSVHTSIANQDGSRIEIPEPPSRRRAIGSGEERHIIMDGALLDWGKIKPAVIGLASNGSPTLRLLRIMAWPDTGDHHLYFAVTAYLGSDHPYADDNMYLREPGQSLLIGAPGVLDNDAIPGGAPLTAQKVSDPARGTVTLNADGSFTYSPNHPQVLTDDEFEYKAVGGGKESNVARVVIQVNQGENPVAPEDDEYSTREDKTLIEAAPGVLANDRPNPNVLDATLVTAPLHGTVTLNKDGGFTYVPKKHYFGDDTFVYKAAKKEGADHGIGGEATVTIHVESVNDAPTFNAGPSPVNTTIGSGPYSAQWATNISPGPNNESGQAVNFIVSNNNNALFSVQPQISPSGVLTFTPAGSPGTATVSVQLHDNGGTARGGSDTSPAVTLIINITCGGTITVTNPANGNGTANAAFSETFTQSGGVGATTFSLNSGTLPAGLALAPNGVLSGTPTQTGSFPITVAATDSQGCIGVGPTYTIVIGCQTITVTNPANGNGTANAAFSETFTQTGGIGTTTFALASGTLPTGLTLAANGTLSGTPTETGSFPITVTATDANGCSGTGTTYTIVIGCQAITVNNPANGNGAVSAPFSETFTQTGAIGTATFTLASGTLPAGLTLAANGTVSGTPAQTGSFPITVTVTDANGCTGTSGTYTITVGCQTITVNNPANTAGTVSAPFSETFTQSGAVGGATFTLASGTLPAGLTLAANGTLSGTPTEDGSFPITVLVTDANGCTGTSATYTLVIACQTITVNNPSNATGPAGSPFSETFTQTGAVGTATFTLASGTLPTGLTLAPNGVLSGTPTQGGTFPITVTVTDANGCTGTGAVYTLVITCPTITVNNPANANGTANAAFSETFTASGGVGTYTYSLASGTLPTGLSLAANGTLSGTPTQTGSFPITVTATDANGCTGTSATYTIVIACQTITVNNPANGNGTANAAFSETFTQTGGIGTTTFSLASGSLPTGLTLAPNGTLSGTPTETGSFPITVTATDANGCTGTGGTYTIVIACQTITVNNPANGNGTASAPFSETFTQTGGIGTTTFSLASGTLPAGLTLAPNGTLSGTPTQTGSFPITVTATDANGCTGTGGTYTIVIGCQTITVNNPANTAGTVSAPFSETFTQSGAIGSATFTTASTLPAGLTLATNGVLSGTPTEDGTFPIVVTVTDANGCMGTSATYNLVIGCQTITVTNPSNATGPAGSPFSETFTQSGAIGTATFTTASTLPTGLTLAPNGVLSGTPTQGGTFPITVTVTDANGCTGTGAVYTLVITCPIITVNNPANGNGTANAAFSETFTASGGIGTYTYSLASGTLPAGLTLAANGTLSGTPTQTGSFPITVTATDSNGCMGTGGTYTIVIGCQTITVTNPANGNGTAGSAFSETFTQTGGIGTTTFSLASGTLPAGLTLAANGTLSGTPTQTGSFPITVTATDSNGCTGTGATYTIVIACQTINVSNPANAAGTVSAPFSETFTQTGAIGTATFTTASTLPAGLTLAANGVLSGTPTEDGTFPIVVTVTDANGCTGTGATYNLTIGCQTITVNNPANTGGTVSAGFSETFTQTGAVGGATFTLDSGVLPAGLTLATNGTLSGTPTEDGSFPITVLVTDGNGCTGTSATYTLVIACQTITVTNPSNATGPAGSPFSETFTQSGAIGTATFTTASTLPTGITLAANGVLSGTPTQNGTFPIVVTVTDANGCTGTSDTYTLVITCQTITVNNPANGNGTAGSAFSETFTQTGGIGTTTFSLASGTLPAGLTLAANGVLSGTPTQTGSFPITVTATDANGCTGTGATYTITIACQVITVTNPANANGTANSAFSETFTQTDGIGTTTFSLASGTLPAGLTLAANGVLSGTPTQTGSFPITVTATDANGCTGTGATYTIVIACQVITVNNPANGNGTAGAAFTETFTATNTIGTTTFTLASGTLPAGLTLAPNGVLSGTPTQTGSFPITVTATDANSCSGTGGTYTITIACQTITVTNPANAAGTVSAVFNETFTQTGAIGTATFTTASTLPAGLTLGTNGVLSGTPTEDGTFPIVVTVTDANGCTGTGATYNLTIACQTITVTEPGVNTGTAGTAFSQQFTQTGGVGTTTFTTSSTLPAGLVLQADGTLAGTPTQTGTFPIVVTATDSNGCTGTSATYTLTISCQTITVTNPATTSIQAGQTLGAAFTFTATGILGTANWTLESGTLPAGITLNATSGQLEGSSTAQGSYPITVRVTDTNGCFDISDTYTLDVVCPVITVARTGGGAFPNGTFNAAYTGQSFTGSGGTAPYTFAVTAGTFPTGLTLNNDGTISGTPTATGTFVFTVTATDASLCPGSQSFSIAISPSAGNDSYSNLVNNTQAVVTGGTTASPATPFVPLTGVLIGNDQPAGGVTIVGGTFATTQGGSVTIASDGTFIYTPPVTASPLATDSFNYTIASNTGGTGTPTQAIGLVTLNLAGRVWYVKNDGANGDGRSHSPFNSTSNFVNGARVGPDTPGDIIFIHTGDGTTTNLATGVTLLDNEVLHGQGSALVVNTHTLVPAGAKPQLTNAAGSVVTLGNGNTVRGLTVTGAGAGGRNIAGTAKTAFTGENLTLSAATGSGISLTTFAGAVTLTNTTITNNAIGVTLSGGSPTVTIDNTNSITANAGQRSINFGSLGATAIVSVAAPITDNGLGISVANSAAGAVVSFTGTQTLSTTTNTAVSLTTNTGATISFSGALGITTSSGSGFVATGGGTLNVSGTAAITTGAATVGLNLNGMTVGGSGVAFNSVTTTAATTGINLTNVAGTVSVNGGTLTNGTTGIFMQGSSTNLSLANVTITGPTTGITNTANFGTLTIGASVNVSAVTALNLTTGTVSGTFANVSSTGGTNGVNLNAVSGAWGTTAGSLTGAAGATFNVSGTAAVGSAITWGGTITQNNAATAVTVSSHNRNVTFNGNITTGGTSTGISLASSSGTYLFNGTNTIAGSGGGIAIGLNTSGTITFSNNSSINTAGTAFSVAGAGGAVTAAITYGGTITKNSGGTLISVDNLDSPGTLSMTHTPSAAGNITQNNNGANGISIINSSSTNITIENASVTFNNAAAGFTASGNSGTIHLPGLALTGNGNKAGMLISGAGTINVNAGAANPSINMSGGSTAAANAINGTTTAFTGTLNLTNVTITGHNAADIVTLGGGTLGGTGSTISGAQRALVLSGVALTNGAGMTSIASTGGANGISLTNVTGGTYTVGSGGNLSGNTGSAFLVSGSSATFSYAGNITQNTAGQRAVNISGVTGGTITLSGAIGSSGGTGVTIAGTGGTVTLTGAMTLSGTASVFTVSGAGLTINANNTANSVGNPTAATATGVSITSSTIGASGVTFQRVSVNGGTNGIVLNGTGNTGAFLVRGDNTLARNGSGGTINNTGGDAIQLTNANNVTLQSMNLTSNGSNPATAADAAGTGGNHTVQVSGGSNVVLSGVFIDASDGSGFVALNVGGTNRLNNNTRFENTPAGAGHSVYVNNTNTNMTLFEVNNVQMIDNSATHTNFFFANTGTSNMALTVQNNCLFEDLGTQALTVAAGGTAATTGTLTSNILNSDFQNAKGLAENNVGILVNNGANHVSTVQGNLFENIAKDGTIANTSIIRTQNSGGDMTATITGNTIQNITYAAGFGGRHVIGHVFEPVAYSAGDSSTLFITSNTITNVTYPALGNNREAIFVDYRPTASSGEVTIQGNNFNMPTSGAQQAMELRFRQTNPSSVNVLVRGNTGTHNTAAAFLDIDAEDATTVQLTVDGGNNFTNSNGTPGSTIAVTTEDPAAAGGPPSMCVNITGNTLQGGAGTISLDETAGTMTVTQASAAALAAANGIPGGNVTTTGTPAFGAAACTLP